MSRKALAAGSQRANPANYRRLAPCRSIIPSFKFLAKPVTTPISTVFEMCRREKRLALMPFITAGDPSMSATQQVLRELGQRGADLIEVGFPYSDPIADGPVIQSSYTRALRKHLHVADIFQGLAALKSENLPPRLAMVSYAIIFRWGVDRFLDAAVVAGFAGLIVPDLPGDEAGELFVQVRNRGLDLIQLIAPTTPRARVPGILKSCSGFVYCIAVAGTTGVREAISPELLVELKSLRTQTDLPLAVGFGISRPEHLAPLKGLADGAIVGSALVRYLETIVDGDGTAVKNMGDAVSELAHACR